ncbi:barstar family protein [Streptomyces incarnatus]
MVTIDVTSVRDESGLRDLLKRKLDFLDLYGHNWSASWDVISGLVLIPAHVWFVGWGSLLEHVPEGGAMLRTCLDRYHDRYRPGLRVEHAQPNRWLARAG